MSDNRDPNDDMSWLDDLNNSASTPPAGSDPLGSDELVMPDWDLFAVTSCRASPTTRPSSPMRYRRGCKPARQKVKNPP
ncbi:MAG: hypothetical protein MUF38_08310 [Anaerolineae bacterium]|nr:hypothetical protein [Anaerolineae bacterium]